MQIRKKVICTGLVSLNNYIKLLFVNTNKYYYHYKTKENRMKLKSKSTSSCKKRFYSRKSKIRNTKTRIGNDHHMMYFYREKHVSIISA